jgi:hypothetical protein
MTPKILEMRAEQSLHQNVPSVISYLASEFDDISATVKPVPPPPRLSEEKKGIVPPRLKKTGGFFISVSYLLMRSVKRTFGPFYFIRRNDFFVFFTLHGFLGIPERFR